MTDETNEVQETSLRDDLQSAMAAVNEKQVDDAPETPAKPVTDDKRDESGRFKAKEAVPDAPVVEAATETPVVPVVDKDIEPPVALSGAMKAKWKELPADVRAEWSKRESDVHQMFTRHDGELNMGRQMKEVIAPYMPIITAEGGTPAGAVKDLLNTAYILRTGTPQSKAAILAKVAEQYGVDMSQVAEPQYVDPQYADLQKQIEDLKQLANPDVIKSRLQEQMEADTINAEVQAFAANPANVHFEQLRPIMAAMFQSGTASTVQEAYDKACWSDPSIRSTLLAKQTADEQAKRQTEMAAKKNAASSITGSPGITVPNTGSPHRDLREELAYQFQQARNSQV